MFVYDTNKDMPFGIGSILPLKSLMDEQVSYLESRFICSHFA